jgi:hypothetical protein
VGILSHKESIEDHEGFMAMFRNGESPLYHCEAIADTGSMGRSRRHCLVRLRGYWSLEIRLHTYRQTKPGGSLAGRLQFSHALCQEQFL